MKKIKIKIKKEDGALKAAKQGAKAKVKSEFKFNVAEAKSSDLPKKTIKSMISEDKKGYKAAKKEIKKYTDY